MDAVQESGEATAAAELLAEMQRAGKVPVGAQVQSGSFRVVSRRTATAGEEESGMIRPPAAVSGPVAGAVTREQVILDDLIVDGSACIGVDCVNGESFGFDTIRLKENNLRIKFQDTRSTSSIPSADRHLTANDSASGGLNKFSIDNITDPGSRTPFTIEAGAPSHSLYIDDGGRIGTGTSTPVVDAQGVSGNTPTLQLEQNGSSGFTPQTWDVAGNEANFFIRDASGGRGSRSGSSRELQTTVFSSRATATSDSVLTTRRLEFTHASLVLFFRAVCSSSRTVGRLRSSSSTPKQATAGSFTRWETLSSSRRSDPALT